MKNKGPDESGLFYIASMKVEFLDDISQGGKFKGVVSDRLVRLWDFTPLEAEQLRQAVISFAQDINSELDLSSLPFIETVNCQLIFRKTTEETGVQTSDKKLFYCDFTPAGMMHIAYLMEPFCPFDKAAYGYQWLDEIASTDIDLLFSPGGTW